MLAWILESSLLVLLILGIRKLFMGKIRYTGMYALWFFVLIRFLIPVHFISTPFSVGNIMSETMASWTDETDTEPSRKTADQTGRYQYQNVHTEELEKNKKVSSASGLYQGTERTDMQKETVVSAENRISQTDSSHDRVRSLLFWGWGLVSGFLFLWFILSNVSLNRRIKRNRVLYGTREHIRIYTVSCIKNPCLYGFFRPAIYLPRDLVSGEHGELESKEEVGQMIMHEYVHYCHRDHIWAMFRILLVSVYWFDPFLWIAISCSKKDAELACDETVIERLGENKRFSYGEMLVRLASDTSWGDFRYSLMAMSRKGKEMEKRIRAISSCKRYSKWILIPLVSALLLTVCITGSTGIRPLAREQKDAQSVLEDNGQTSHASDGKLLFGASAEQIGGPIQKSQLTQLSNAGFYSNYYFSSRDEKQDSYEDVFYQYVDSFTEAVNTGNTALLDEVLVEESDVYKQQAAIAKNYFKRGIREEVKACSISSVKKMGADVVKLKSKEKIQVSYVDAASKIIDQTYLYTCEKRDQNWRITKMDEISLVEKWE